LRSMDQAVEIHFQDEAQEEEKTVCLLHQLLGYDHLISIFANADGFALCRFAEVCKLWRSVATDPLCWQACCAQVWWRGGLHQIQNYGSWMEMYINRPHVRFDGLYMLERSWFRAAGNSWISPVGTVIKTGWYRYLRFRPNGKVLYTVVAQPIRNMKEWHKGVKEGRYVYHAGALQLNIDMEYMDSYMQIEFVPPPRGGLVHDGLKVTSYHAMYKGEYHRFEPPGTFEIQRLKALPPPAEEKN